MPKVQAVLAQLKRKGTKRNRDGMARYAIVAPKVMGVSVGDLRAMGKRVGRDHALAIALWKTGWYEARMLASFVADPERVTAPLMDRWARDFDNWAICDTVCFSLFDRAPDAWSRLDPWARDERELVRRASFALLWSLALHDRSADDARFVAGLELVEQYAADERPLVTKSMSMSLRAIRRRSPALEKAVRATAERLAEADSGPERRVGRTALRESGS